MISGLREAFCFCFVFLIFFDVASTLSAPILDVRCALSVHAPIIYSAGPRQREAAARLKRVMWQREVAENVIVAPIRSDLLLQIYQRPSSVTLEFLH